MTRQEQMCEDIRSAEGVQGGIELTQWEEEFMENIEEILADAGSLSERQQEILEGIWNRI